MRSAYDSHPSRFQDKEWLFSPYTPDGRTVFGLIHDEYQGNTHPGRCATGDYLRCWYNAITLARSDDGGATFHHALPTPRHLVAEVPYRYKPDVGRVRRLPAEQHRPEGRLLLLDGDHDRVRQAGARARCVMRTKRLDDPTAWRAWDGDGYNVSFVDPYRGKPAVNDHLCKPVSSEQISDMTFSLTYNTYFGKYLLVAPANQYIASKRRLVSGFFYSLSGDLIHWSQRKLIKEVELLQTYRCGDRDPVFYPSVLDPNSKSRNFETTGRHAYLYFTRLHYEACQQTLNRDLVRVPVEFSEVTGALQVVVSGMVAGDPFQGGASWAVLQYVLGLQRLGHEVLLIEEYEPKEGTPSASYFEQVIASFDLTDSAALLPRGTREPLGLPYARLRERCAGADLLINVSGILTDPDLISSIPVRAYLDLDPVFNQLWDRDGIDMRFGPHNRFVTVGQALGTAECPVPTGDREWIPTLPPVVLDRWPVAEGPGDGSFTSVGNWRGYGSVEHGGVHYGQRVHSMRPLMELPLRALRPTSASPSRSTPRSTSDLEAAGGQPLGAGRPGRGGRHARSATPQFIARSTRRARNREERLRAVALGLVQRSERLLPRLRPAGARAGDGLQPVPAHGRGAAGVRDRGRRGRGRRGDPRRLRSAREPRAGAGRGPARLGSRAPGLLERLGEGK